MINYFRMKKNEWKIKNIVYKMILSFIDEKSNMVDLLKKLYITLKDVPIDDLREEFVSKLVEIVHEKNIQK